MAEDKPIITVRECAECREGICAEYADLRLDLQRVKYTVYFLVVLTGVNVIEGLARGLIGG